MVNEDNESTIFKLLIEAIIEAIPYGDEEFKKNVVRLINKHLKPIFDEIESSRLPTFALVGRRGSGKSSLINAIFDRHLAPIGSVVTETPTNEWITFVDKDGNKIAELMDTRGVQEGSRPKDAPEIESLAALIKAFKEKTPDCFLFLEKSKEVSAAIEGDLLAFSKCIDLVFDKEKYVPLIIGIPTQCDELDPPGFWDKKDRDFYSKYWDCGENEIPSNSEDLSDFEYRLEKLKNIRLSTKVWAQHLKSIPSISKNKSNLRTIPIAAYLRFRKDKTLDLHPDADKRWNIDNLKKLILDELPKDAKISFIREAREKAGQKKFSNRVITATSALCFAIGVAPTPPGFDLPFLFAVQITQILLIGFISGRKMNWETGKEFLLATGLQSGAAFLLREGFRAGIKLIPILGWLVAGGIAGGGTAISGVMAEAYFIDGQTITVKKAQEIIREQRKAENNL